MVELVFVSLALILIWGLSRSLKNVANRPRLLMQGATQLTSDYWLLAEVCPGDLVFAQVLDQQRVPLLVTSENCTRIRAAGRCGGIAVVKVYRLATGALQLELE